MFSEFSALWLFGTGENATVEHRIMPMCISLYSICDSYDSKQRRRSGYKRNGMTFWF